MLEGIDCQPGIIVFDNLNLDLTRPLSGQADHLQEDLLQIVFPEGFVVDVGWYWEDFEVSGCFRVFVVQNADWEMPVFERSCDDLKLLKEGLQQAIDFVRSKL